VADVRDALARLYPGDARSADVQRQRSAYVSQVVGRPVRRLSELTAAEARAVRDRADAGEVAA
jgi:hypothetical protein